MKVLVVGCGSIGRRHINNLLKREEIEKVIVYSKVKDCLASLNNSQGRIELVKDLRDVNADFAIICNETSKHLETAVLLAQKGIHLFIEKPLSHNLDNIDALEEAVGVKKIKVFIGYNLRFLGAINYLKSELENNLLGDLYFSRIEAGQYLPQWREARDYRKTYSASRRMGGGVALDLSHEIDYMRYFFGSPQYYKSVSAKVSDLEIDSDDIFEGIYVFGNNFICSVHLDYLQAEKTRKIHIFGSKGSAHCDFIKKEIRVKRSPEDEKVIDNAGYFDLEQTYVDELEHFISALEDDFEPKITLEDGREVLKLIEGVNVQRQEDTLCYTRKKRL